MANNLSDIVSVAVQLTTPGVARAEFGRTLLLTRDASLDTTGPTRVRTFSRASDLADSGLGAGVLSAARVYFSQDPAPRDLLVGRHVNVDTRSEVRGGAPSAIGSLTSVSDGTLRFAGTNITNINLSSAADFAAVAAAVQTRIRAIGSLSSASVEYQATPGRFVLSVPHTVQNAGFVETHSGGAGTDLSSLLALTADEGATFHMGRAAETVAQALDRIREIDRNFSLLALDPALDGTDAIIDASAWAQSNGIVFFAASSETAALAANESASAAARLSDTDPRYTAGVFSRRNDGKALSLAGFFSSINYDAGGSLRTGNLAELPGTVDDVFSADEVRELQRKNWNFTAFNGLLSDGRLLNGDWIDVRVWVRWFQNALQTDVFQKLATNRIPQTNAGIGVLHDTLTTVCEQGVTNGGIAGSATAPAEMKAEIVRETGNLDFNGILSKGYLVWVPPIGVQSTTQRATRIAPPFRIWAVGGGFLHGAAINVTFQP